MKELCMVGGWMMPAVAGDDYTFGTGGELWGPVPLSAGHDSTQVEGHTVALPLGKEWADTFFGRHPVATDAYQLRSGVAPATWAAYAEWAQAVGHPAAVVEEARRRAR